ncbi:hypothetical protein [Rhodopseudomonas faecalis]|uniref:hypothetical protein n=1 Tax=Rhodopseudomonas faecalis TaxID=99655 RepID=UPI0011B3BE7F|nr:hypothetical protein [Rhodopseudomonas faecalis]
MRALIVGGQWAEFGDVATDLCFKQIDLGLMLGGLLFRAAAAAHFLLSDFALLVGALPRLVLFDGSVDSEFEKIGKCLTQ